MDDQKLFVGQRIRRLRKERGLTQARMAEDLGISTSYLNLLERNQRPLTAQTLLRLAQSYDIDVKEFSGSAEARATALLQEVFRDPLFEGRIGEAEIRDLAAASPEACEAVSVLYQAWREAADGAAELAERLAGEGENTGPADRLRSPIEEVRDYLTRARNHFPDLEAAAESLHERAALEKDAMYGGLARHLTGTLQVGVAVVPVDVMPDTLRRYDRHRRRVLLSEVLPESGRVFQLAYEICLLECRDLLDRLVDEGGFGSHAAQRLARSHLANYFAGAVMMPYERFLAAAESLRYDVDLLGRRFGASYEQVGHRLTTMQRPGARGIPFFLIRIDAAGNVSKRFSAGTFQFARLGGACPRWNVHRAFQIPGRIFTQIVRMPAGETYFSIARTVARAGASSGPGDADPLMALGLGFDIHHAGRVVYADGIDAANDAAVTPIGINCRLCERPDCAERALPPINRKLIVDEHRRDVAPFAFMD
jgi:predicted transcriptional regulator/DNA-binding XRE family transcriptional regulator